MRSLRTYICNVLTFKAHLRIYKDKNNTKNLKMTKNTENSRVVKIKKSFTNEEQAILRACLKNSDIVEIGKNAANNSGKKKHYSSFTIWDALRGARRNFAIELELRKKYEQIIQLKYHAVNTDK